MNQFAYSDIFDTKGIEYIIVIGFLLLIIPFSIFLNRPVKWKRKVQALAGGLSINALNIPQGLFFSKNHTWSFLEKSGLASVGIDDLLLHLTGGVEVEYLRQNQEKVKRGEPIARIIQEGKNLVISSPLSGKIESVHTSLEGEKIDDQPYESWFYKIKPDNWSRETSECFLAEKAVEWERNELDAFKDFFAAGAARSPQLSEVILQEGGELSEFLMKEMQKEVWDEFQMRFLNL